jgi:hypothetical protein
MPTERGHIAARRNHLGDNRPTIICLAHCRDGHLGIIGIVRLLHDDHERLRRGPGAGAHVEHVTRVGDEGLNAQRAAGDVEVDQEQAILDAQLATDGVVA